MRFKDVLWAAARVGIDISSEGFWEMRPDILYLTLDAREHKIQEEKMLWRTLYALQPTEEEIDWLAEMPLPMVDRPLDSARGDSLMSEEEIAELAAYYDNVKVVSEVKVL